MAYVHRDRKARNHLLFYSILFYSILFYSILFYSILREEDGRCWRQGLGEGRVFGYERQDVRPNRIKRNFKTCRLGQQTDKSREDKSCSVYST